MNKLECVHEASKIKIFLHGNNHDTNRGCQALRMSTAMILDRYFPSSPRIEANIFYNHETTHFEHCGSHSPEKQIAEISPVRNAAFYLWGGMLCGCRFWGIPTPMKVKSFMLDTLHSAWLPVLIAEGGDNWSLDYGALALYLFTEPFRFAIKQHIPTFLLGASVGPFTDAPRTEHWMRKLLPSLNGIFVRESLSREYLSSIGVEENVYQVADPAFLLPQNEPEHLPEEIHNVLERGAIGLNFSPLLMRYKKQSRLVWLKEMAALIVSLLKEIDFPILLIPHVMMEPSVFPQNNDLLFLSDILQEIPEIYRERVFLYDSSKDDCTEIKWVLARLQAFIGARTHATIGALSTGIPTFSIGYSIKSRGINRDIFGHEEWVEHFTKLNTRTFPRQIKKLLDSKNEVQACLGKRIPEMKKMAWKNGAILKEIISRIN